MRTPTPIRFENSITVDPKKIPLEVKSGAGAPFKTKNSEIKQTRTRTWAYLGKIILPNMTLLGIIEIPVD